MSSISTKQLAMYAVDQLEAGIELKTVSRKLAGFLLHERRSRDAGALYRAIEKELYSRGATQVVITSAHEVNQSTKQQLAEMLHAKNPVFDEIIDPDVIGGVKARAGESEIDLTVRARLNKFKQHVITNSR